jgi:hypothetical protein
MAAAKPGCYLHRGTGLDLSRGRILKSNIALEMDDELVRVKLKPNEFHGDWNYTITPLKSKG